MPGGDPLATCTLPVGDVYLLTTCSQLGGPMMRRQNAHGLDNLLQSGCRPAVEDAFEILDVD
jgi:hypothetical protein